MIPLLSQHDGTYPAMTTADACRIIREYEKTGTVEELKKYRCYGSLIGGSMGLYYDIADSPCILNYRMSPLERMISLRTKDNYNLTDGTGRIRFLMDWEGTQPLTIDALKTLLSQKHSSLSPNDFLPYFANKYPSDDGTVTGYYVSDDYQLVIKAPASCEHSVPQNQKHFHFELYHLDDPDTRINLLEDDLDAFLARELPAPRHLSFDRLEKLFIEKGDSVTLSDFYPYKLNCIYSSGTHEYAVSDQYRIMVNQEEDTIRMYHISDSAFQRKLKSDFTTRPLDSIRTFPNKVAQSKTQRKGVRYKSNEYVISSCETKLPSKYTFEAVTELRAPIAYKNYSLSSNYFRKGTEIYVWKDSDDFILGDYIYVREPDANVYFKMIKNDHLPEDDLPLLSLEELCDMLVQYGQSQISPNLEGYHFITVQNNEIVRHLYEITGSPYMLEVHTPGITIATMRLCDLSGEVVYNLKNPTDRADFLADWSNLYS